MEAAKKARSLSKGRFTRTINALNTAINTNSLPVTVNRRYEDIRGIWKTVQDKHDEYINLAEESEENEQWISGVCDTFSNAEIRADEYIQECMTKAEIELEETQCRKQQEENDAREIFEKTRIGEVTKLNLSDAINCRKQECSKVEMQIESIELLLGETDLGKRPLIATTLPEGKLQLENNMKTC